MAPDRPAFSGLSEPLHRPRASPRTGSSSIPGPGHTPDLGAAALGSVLVLFPMDG